MPLSQLTGAIMRNVKEHSSILLSIGAGVGTIATAYLTGKASFEAAEIIRVDELKKSARRGYNPTSRERLTERTKLVWKLYIPPAIATTATIVCIVGAKRVDAKKTLAAQTLLAYTQRAYSDYRDKVIEEFGERKDQSIRAAVAQDRVDQKPPPSGETLIVGTGSVLCCEQYTGRYFSSDMQTLRTAINNINDRMLKHDYATLSDWYYELGLDFTSASSQLGWRCDRLLDLDFSSVLTNDGRPCLVFEYNYIKEL